MRNEGAGTLVARGTVALLIAIGLPSALERMAKAQDPIAVQLPTFSYFATDSSVLVPDRGTAVLGGVSRSSSGSNQFGGPFIPSTRSYGAGASAGGVTVSAQIHDMDEMDRQVLAGAAQKSGRDVRFGAPINAPVPGGQVLGPDSAPMASVEELAARKRASAAAGQQEVEQFVSKAREAQAAGKSGAAKVYLQMAARRAAGTRKAEILAMIAAIDSAARPAAGTTVAAPDGAQNSAAKPPFATAR